MEFTMLLLIFPTSLYKSNARQEKSKLLQHSLETIRFQSQISNLYQIRNDLLNSQFNQIDRIAR